MNKVLIGILFLSQLSVFECLHTPENSVEVCFTTDNKPAVCVGPDLCSTLQTDKPIESLKSCTESTVCCPINDGTEYRDAFIVPKWDWAEWFPSNQWNRPTSRPTLATFRPLPIIPVMGPNVNITGGAVTTSSPPASAAASATASPPASSNTSISSAGCGSRNNVNQKDMDDLGYIVGGNEAPQHSWPWVVGLYSSGRFVCGASIIDSRYILCAAHCVSHGGRITKADQLQVLLGAHDRSKSGQMLKVEKVIVHSGYNERIMQNDISMFKLEKPITFGPTISPICLPPNGEMCSDSNKQMVYLAGWGTTSAGGSTSNTLREVAVPVIPLKECQKAYDSTMVTSKQICCGLLGVGGKDSCQGDSGGPMVVRPDSKANKYFQCGIVSWGRGCAEARYPGVYTKVPEYADWIRSNKAN